MTGSQIRQQFLDYFASKEHRIVRSSSLVPANDPTLLFTNAGMNQFKDVFLGQEKRDYVRATTSQKCVRAGGKHNDLENVGYTRRHHTFFEMLGNFSFGDYFKADAIAYAWELITEVYGLPKDKLFVTVFREDDQAEMLWQQITGIPKSRIFRLDEKDNFWQMGETGPCGPCSEIHYDLGIEAAEPGREHEEFPSDAGGRFVEIWNLVFMEFDRDANGVLTPLPKPSIDTGMGLERLAAVLQGKLSNYDTDLIRPVIDKCAELFKVESGDDERVNVALRINADHARATTFLISDGVLPSNEGRGYVLRKIMRRAMRHARRLGVMDPYLYQLTGFVADLMKDAYPELLETIQRVARVVKDEEHRYATTFHVAERMFQDEAKAATAGVLPGSAAFKLYDTYGLPLEEQEELAREFGLQIDVEGFQQEMEKQRTRARASWRGADRAQIPEVYLSLPPTEFIGRETLESPVQVVRVIQRNGDTELVFDKTPFYAEAGGQVGDQGVLLDPKTGDRVAIIEDTYKPAPTAVVHRAKLLGPVHEGATLVGRVERNARESTMRNHTATHLLHAALRSVLGKHVKQAGSVVAPDRLRFDFTHYAAVDDDELAEIERVTNQQILANTPVQTEVMDLDNALQTGAMALFGEKYGDKVRVVEVPGFSKELCGGTHVLRTGDIGICKIVSEGSISAGIRRIEAISGEGALDRFQQTTGALARISDVLHTRPEELMDHVQKLLEHERSLEKQIEQMKTKFAQAQAGSIEQNARDVKGVKVLAATVEGMDRAQMRVLIDSLRNKWKSAVLVLASTNNGDIAIVSAVTKDLTSKVHAGKLASGVAQAVGGKGGGRPDMAEAGGKDPAGLPGALADVYTKVEAML